MSRAHAILVVLVVGACKREAPTHETAPTASETPVASASASEVAPTVVCGARRIAADGGCVRDPAWSIEQIALAENYACARYKSGDVRCAGYRTPAGADSVYAAVEIATGRLHACARQKGGTVFCWGTNDEGQIGDGTTNTTSAPSIVQGVTDATAIAAGMGHTCAIRSNGKVACWGSNFEGQVDGKKGDNRRTAVDVPGVAGATRLALGLTFSCARLVDGSITCWGDFPLNRADKAPRVVPGLRGDDIAVTGAAFHPELCARAGRTIRCVAGDEQHASPQAITDITDATAVVAGIDSICALEKSGTVGCVRPGSDRATLPVPPARSIAIGGLHVCTIGVDGELACREEDGKPLDDVFRGMQTL